MKVIQNMKCSGQCDVEVSVTLDEKETIKAIPEFLQEAFLSSSPTELETSRYNHVTLPRRYAPWASDSRHRNEADPDEKTEDRENDMTKALEWLKEEMVIMRAQDKALLKQFVALRSKILQLRRAFELQYSLSDQNLSDSTCSLDGPYLEYPNLEMTEFRARTTSMLVPTSKQQKHVTRIKWRSHEYL